MHLFLKYTQPRYDPKPIQHGPLVAANPFGLSSLQEVRPVFTGLLRMQRNRLGIQPYQRLTQR
jgi:hypothetical protein